MKLAKEARRFREAVKRGGPRKRTTPYPGFLRAEAMEYFEARRAAGASTYAVAKELGLGVDTLRRWSRPRAPLEAVVSTRSFAPVEVIAGSARPVESRSVVYGPCGLRIEGLDMEEVAELIRRLQ